MKTKIIISVFLSLFLLQMNIPIIIAQPATYLVDNGDNTITDNINGLMWRKSTPSPITSPAVTWEKAVEITSQLNLGGYNDWRLPTIEEWATIIDVRNQFPALVEPNPFENVIVSSPYWSLTEYTYGPDYSCDASGCPLKAHVALLYLGYIGHQNKDKNGFIWPVRSMVKVAVATQPPQKEEPPIVEIVKEEVEPSVLSRKGLLFIQPRMLSKEFELQGIERKEQVHLKSYIQMPINKNSKAVLKPKQGGIEIAISIYEIDQRRVTLFNNNAMAFNVPVRMRLEPETGALIFYEQP
jgi:hypothetical protein